jgi:hypothetical protein
MKRTARLTIEKRAVRCLSYFFAMENEIKPIPNIISVMGQGSGSPRGFGLFRIINVESAIRRNPDTIKHIFDNFNINTSSFYSFMTSSKYLLNQQAGKNTVGYFLTGLLNFSKIQNGTPTGLRFLYSFIDKM